jgi:hypothetical protein
MYKKIFCFLFFFSRGIKLTFSTHAIILWLLHGIKRKNQRERKGGVGGVSLFEHANASSGNGFACHARWAGCSICAHEGALGWFA